MTDPGPQNLGQGQLDITPSTAFLRVLQNVNYKPWYALAEFVDNALQSYHSNKDDLERSGSGRYRFHVEIELERDTKRITVRDNAAGIAKADLARALKPGARPPNDAGLSEFGMGMKNAACWFADRWYLQTKALGDSIERRVSFNVPEIIRTESRTIDVQESYVGEGPSYTVLVLEQARHFPVGRTLGKVRSHLAGIYRKFLRPEELTLDVRSLPEVTPAPPIRYEVPPILYAPPQDHPTNEPLLWRKPIEFTVDSVTVKGFVAIREKGSTNNAGIALFRRGRLILGSDDEGYRPPLIFGTPNSYRYQRVFGELELGGIGVTYTKDGLIWPESREGEEEEPATDDEKWLPGLEGKFLRRLKAEINSEPLSLLDQAEGHRARRQTREVLDRATEIARDIEDEFSQGLASVLQSDDGGPKSTGKPIAPEEDPSVSDGSEDGANEFHVRWKNTKFEIAVRVVQGQAHAPWFTTEDEPAIVPAGLVVRKLAIFVALDHPFARRFIGAQGENLDTLERLAAAMAVAELLAKAGGVPPEFALVAMRHYVEQVLRLVFADQGIATGALPFNRAGQK